MTHNGNIHPAESGWMDMGVFGRPRRAADPRTTSRVGGFFYLTDSARLTGAADYLSIPRTKH
jgi:hypothetical protein